MCRGAIDSCRYIHTLVKYGKNSDQQAKKINAKSEEEAQDGHIPTKNRYSILPVDDDAELDLFQNATKKKSVNNTPPIVIELEGERTHQKVRDTVAKYVKEFHVQHRGRKIIRVQCYPHVKVTMNSKMA
ncbi:unnamed protein product [Leptidea sinapis]|uniref:Uncharacterized protein n=1 Tax=Leptidea sinapis TaxID=189913 RepID=A0A5E4PR21_9NEOP|nr:unnamed protein product [Leptidea sinapis]